MSDYWSGEELSWDITTKEAMAIHNSLLSCRDKVRNARVDALVDNQAVVHSWNNQGGRSSSLNIVMKTALCHHDGIECVLTFVLHPD